MSEATLPMGEWKTLCDGYSYLDQGRLSRQIDLLYGRAMEEILFTSTRSRQALYNAVSHYGSSLADLRLTNLDQGCNWDTVPASHQVRALVGYHLQCGTFRGYALETGEEYTFDRDLRVRDHGPILHRDSRFGVVRGLMSVQQIEPPSDNSNLREAVYSDQRSLWVAETPEGSPIRFQMTLWNQGFKRDEMTRRCPEAPGELAKFEAVGLLRWQGDSLVCQPVAATILRDDR